MSQDTGAKSIAVMSLRDCFANTALPQGIKTAAERVGLASEEAPNIAAEFAYKYAAAMLIERDK